MHRSWLATGTALVLTLLVGQVTDKTTGQPLSGVEITLQQRGATLRATTAHDGRFRLSGVQPGAHTLRYASADVPPGSVRVRVRGARQEIDVTACSTTLDYSCAGPGGGG